MSVIIHFCYIIKTINLFKSNYVKVKEVKNLENSLQDKNSSLKGFYRDLGGINVIFE